jgi:hypothetical protein
VRAKESHTLAQELRSLAKLLAGELIGARSRTRDKVRDTKAIVQEFAILCRHEESLSETSAKERTPESISGTGEMVTCRPGVEAGIDATEEHGEIWRKDILHDAISRSGKLCLGRTR